MSIIDQIRQLGEDKMNALVNELAQNETFLKALERIMTTKSYLDKQSEVILNSVNIASKLESRDLSDRLNQVDRQIRKLQKDVTTLQEENKVLKAKLDEAPAKNKK